jgi:hypothetical protein
VKKVLSKPKRVQNRKLIRENNRRLSQEKKKRKFESLPTEETIVLLLSGQVTSDDVMTLAQHRQGKGQNRVVDKIQRLALIGDHRHELKLPPIPCDTKPAKVPMVEAIIDRPYFQEDRIVTDGLENLDSDTKMEIIKKEIQTLHCPLRLLEFISNITKRTVESSAVLLEILQRELSIPTDPALPFRLRQVQQFDGSYESAKLVYAAAVHKGQVSVKPGNWGYFDVDGLLELIPEVFQKYHWITKQPNRAFLTNLTRGKRSILDVHGILYRPYIRVKINTTS